MGLHPSGPKGSLRGILHVGRLSPQGGRALSLENPQGREVLHFFRMPAMNAAPLTDLSRLCIHSVTTRPWPLEESSEHFAKAGVKGITVWRDALAGRDPAQAGRRIRDLGLSIVSLCRGGFFAAATVDGRQKAIDEN